MEHRQRNGPPLRVPHVHAGTIHQGHCPQGDQQASRREADSLRVLQGHIMSLNQVQAIDKAIRYTDKPAPEDFVNKFHGVRQLVDAFTDHMLTCPMPTLHLG